MAVMAESDKEEEEEGRSTKCTPEEYSREERGEMKGSPPIIQKQKCTAGVEQR